MKFPIAFLSLLTTAAYAQHEPKSLRGSVEDFDFLEDNVVTVSPNSVATINCGSGDQCCAQQDSGCAGIDNTGGLSFGGGSTCASGSTPITSGTVEGSGNCIISCTGSCNVSVAAAGGGGGGGPPNSGGGYGGGGGYGRSAGCVYMPRFTCTYNPFCTIDQDGNCAPAPSGQAPPYEEFDEDVDYDSSFDEEDEGSYDMAAEE